MTSQFFDDQKTRKPEDLLPSSQSLGLAKEINQRPEGDDMMQEVEVKWGRLQRRRKGYLLDISWGAWASPSLSFCPFFNSCHHSPIPTLENFPHTKLNIILLATLV
jgi:hypothetical protein